MNKTERLTLTERLKIETHPEHDALEKIPIVAQLARGELSARGYLEILKQLYLVHVRLEELIEKHRDEPRLQATYHDYHPRRDRALADIHHFEPELRSKDIKPNAGTRKLIDLFDSIAKSNPALLLGAFYVLEGSNFGATFLVKIFQQTYGLEEAGVSYYLGHKHELKPRWDMFKVQINAGFLDFDEQEELLEIAKQTFALMGELYLNINLDEGEQLNKRAAGR